MHTVTCHTEDCPNAGLGLDLFHPAQTIICGPCGHPITDVSPPIPADGYPPEDAEEPDLSPAPSGASA